jgi:hypothetical protein
MPFTEKMLSKVLLTELCINAGHFHCQRTMWKPYNPPACLYKKMEWKNQPTEEWPKLSPPHHLCFQGHKTKIVFIFSLYWHCK